MKGYSNPSRLFSGAQWLLCLGVFTLLLIFPQLSSAQDTGSISGTVVDKSGSAVVGAEVVITSAGGNLTRNTVTNGDGVYVAVALPAGLYDISVSSPGFQKFLATKVKVDVAQKIRVDVALTVGLVTQEVTVTGENVAQVDTQSAEISSTITGKQVQQLELTAEISPSLSPCRPA